MSQHEVDRLIERAMTDKEFRTRLINNPHEAFIEYELTAEEMDILKTLDLDTLPGFSGSLR